MKKYLLLILVLLSSYVLFAQEEEEKQKGFQKDKVFFGGNFGVGFGNITRINISPQIGYRFTDHLAAGTGINFQYVAVKEKYSNGNLFYKSLQGVVGLNVFGRLYPIRQFMLQVQPEANYIFGKEIYYDSNPRQEYTLDTKIVPSLLTGGGLVLPSGRGAMIIAVFYDVLQHESSPYGNKPILNFTFNVGL